MADLTTADLESFTKNKLLQGDRETYRLLNAALREVRNYCQWHVSPVVTETVTLDGPGDWVLYLPTKRIMSVASVVEDGVTLNVSTDISWSEHGEVVKPTANALWNRMWSSKFRSIVVTFTHGYAEPEAEDWRSIVLAVAERMSQAKGLVGRADLQVGPYRVGAFDPDVNPYQDLFDMIDAKQYVRFEV